MRTAGAEELLQRHQEQGGHLQRRRHPAAGPPAQVSTPEHAHHGRGHPAGVRLCGEMRDFVLATPEFWPQASFHWMEIKMTGGRFSKLFRLDVKVIQCLKY